MNAQGLLKKPGAAPLATALIFELEGVVPFKVKSTLTSLASGLVVNLFYSPQVLNSGLGSSLPVRLLSEWS